MKYPFRIISLTILITFFLTTPLIISASDYWKTDSQTYTSIHYTTYSSNNHQIDNSNIAKKHRLQHFSEGNVVQYIKSLFQPYLYYSKISYIAALLVFLLYLFYFRYIDIYEHEPWKYIILTFFTGILFADLGIILYDFTTVVIGWHMNDNLINDFFYTILVIGGIEELVKIIPLILLLHFTKTINEPIDYIIYAGVAALGFAFSENVMYFDRAGISIVFGRALTAVVLHSSLSGIVAYGFVLRDYRSKKFAPIKMYFIAIILHGLYDLFLMNPIAQNLILLAYLILFASIIIFNRAISNSLSNSPFYSKYIHLEVRKIQFLLIGGLIGIFIFQVILLTIADSWAIAKDNILSSATIAVVLIPALVVGFGKIEIHPKKWKSIKLPLLFTKIVIDSEEELIKTHLSFSPITVNKVMFNFFPNQGEIYKQSTDSKNRTWFFIRLEHLGKQSKYNNKHIIIRSKFGNELLNETNAKGIAGIYLLKKTNQKPVFIGWCSVEEMIDISKIDAN